MNYLNNLKNNVKLNKISGFCTPNGTKDFINRIPSNIDKSNYNTLFNSNISLSNIGYGSYLGAPNLADDIKMFNSLENVILKYGINNIDTAINYRYMRSEKTIGYKLNELVNEKKIKRESLFISSKGGFLTPEYYDQKGLEIENIKNELIKKELVKEEEIYSESYCLTNKYLEYSLNKSLTNLGIETLDLFYIHNPAETTLSLIGEDKFYKQIEENFIFLEECIEKNKIKNYGISSWISFRARPEEIGIYLDLEKLKKIAEKVGGKKNGFKFIQLPINLVMHESFNWEWQQISYELYIKLKDIKQLKENENFHKKKLVNILNLAKLLDINVFSSNPLYQGMLIKNFPINPLTIRCRNKGEANLSILKSLPYQSLKSILVGNKQKNHYEENLVTMEKGKLNLENVFAEFNKVNKQNN